MPVETFNYIDSLVTSNPPASDGLVETDDHLRGIKATLKATFPQITGAAVVTHTQLTNLGSGKVGLAAGTSSEPSAHFLDETTLGFYRSASGTISFTGVLRGNGACPTGLIGDYLSTSIPTGWYELNGQAVSRTGATAALFALLGTMYGLGDGTTTFNLPDIRDLYRRSRGGAWPVGTTLSDTLKTHTHTASAATDGGHSHAASVSDPGHTHGSRSDLVVSSGATLQLAQGGYIFPGTGSAQVSAAYTGISVSIGAGGAHTHSVTVNNAGDATETRPKTVVVVTCIKA